jgi:hypothetical protein
VAHDTLRVSGASAFDVVGQGPQRLIDRVRQILRTSMQSLRAAPHFAAELCSAVARSEMLAVDREAQVYDQPKVGFGQSSEGPSFSSTSTSTRRSKSRASDGMKPMAGDEGKDSRPVSLIAALCVAFSAYPHYDVLSSATHGVTCISTLARSCAAASLGRSLNTDHNAICGPFSGLVA